MQVDKFIAEQVGLLYLQFASAALAASELQEELTLLRSLEDEKDGEKQTDEVPLPSDLTGTLPDTEPLRDDYGPIR